MPSLGLQAVRHLKNRLESRTITRFRRIVTTGSRRGSDDNCPHPSCSTGGKRNYE
jgi:hypothetical protein